VLQASHAARDPATGEHTPAARRALERTASELRLLQIMFWAHMCNKKTLGVLQTEEGLLRLEERQVLSAAQREGLSAAPPGRRHDLVLQWLSSRLVALQRPQDKVAERAAEARGGAADVALNPSSYDFERRFDDQCIELREQCHMLQTDKVGPQPHAPSLQPHAPSLQPHAPSPQPHAPSPQPHAPSLQPHAPSLQPRAPSLQPRAPSLRVHASSLQLDCLLLTTQGGADATGVPAPGPATGGLTHRAHRARALPQG
jgi:hypothetical protein